MEERGAPCLSDINSTFLPAFQARTPIFVLHRDLQKTEPVPRRTWGNSEAKQSVSPTWLVR